MKKAISIILVVVFIFGLTACGGKGNSVRYIEVSKLTEEENDLVDLLNIDSRNLMYDFELDETVKTLQVNMYQLKDDGWKMFARDNESFKDESGRMALSFDKIIESYRIAIQSDSNTRSSEQLTKVLNENYEVETSSLKERKEIEYEKEIPIIIQVLSSEEISDSIEIDSFYSPEVYEDKEYDSIYAITVMFSEKSINELDKGNN